MSVRISYRKDIDGLRAIAVLLVILSHTHIPGFGGGFVGVDVFFVISGFLITYMIKDEVQSGVFSFSNFYMRRIRRLMPAYFVVALVTTIAAALLLLPEDLHRYSTSLVYSSLSLANFFFWQQGLQYFSPASDQLPLMHMWSLAVEEQYYLLWPLFLLLGYRLFGKRYLALLILGIFFLSLTASQLMASSYSYKTEAYFLLPSRMFELMMGGIVALGYKRLPAFSSKLRWSLSLLGMTLVLVPSYIINEESVFPGLNAFFPCLGTVLIIVTGHDKQIGVNRLLSTPVFVGVGAVSYSLYLWHWPILAFMAYHDVAFTFSNSLQAMTLAFILAYLSWKFIETPFRFKYVFNFRSTLNRLFLLPLAIPMLAGTAFAISPYGYSVVDRTVYERVRAETEIGGLSNGWCHVQRPGKRNLSFDDSFYDCMRGSAQPDAKKAVLWGDSHAGHFAPFLDYIGKQHNFSLAQRSTPGCLPFIESTSQGINPEVCRKFRNDLKVTLGDFDMVFIAARWENLLKESDFGEFEEAIIFATNRVDAVFVFSQVPVFTQAMGDCYIKHHIFGFSGCSPDEHEISYAGYSEANLKIKLLLEKYPQVTLLDLAPVYCDGQQCEPYLGEQPLYHNSDHLSIAGAVAIAQDFEWSPQEQ